MSSGAWYFFLGVVVGCGVSTLLWVLGTLGREDRVERRYQEMKEMLIRLYTMVGSIRHEGEKKQEVGSSRVGWGMDDADRATVEAAGRREEVVRPGPTGGAKAPSWAEEAFFPEGAEEPLTQRHGEHREGQPRMDTNGHE